MRGEGRRAERGVVWETLEWRGIFFSFFFFGGATSSNGLCNIQASLSFLQHSSRFFVPILTHGVDFCRRQVGRVGGRAS